MRKRRGNCLIEQLEQRRLLSGAGITSAGSITIGGLNFPLPAPAPTTGDLGIDGVGIFDTAVAGGTIAIACDVVQTNAMTHVDYTISMVLSGDNVYGNADDIVLDTSSYTHSGGSQFGNIPIPATTPAGNYHLLVAIAPGSPSEAGQTFPADTNPNDDVLDTGVIPVMAAGTSIGSPPPTDYAMVAASAPGSAAAGGFINVVPQVVQIGVATDGNVTVINRSFYTVDVSLSTDNVWGNGDDIALNAVYPLGGEPLFGGFNSGNLQIPSDVAAGNYQLLMKVSSAFSNPSQDTDGNPGDDVLDAGTISVSPYIAADIGITGATFPTTAPAGTGEIDVEPQIVRTGALADVDYNITVSLSTDGTSFNYALSPDQASDSDYPLFHSGQIFIPNAAPPGTYHVLIKVVPATSSADYYLQNADSDSSDNLIDAGMITLTPNDTNDIGVTGATFPASAAVGSTIKVDPTLVQTGDLSYTDFRVSVVLSSSGAPGDSGNILLENSDSSYYSDSIAIPSTVVAGTYQLLVETQAQPSEYPQPPADTDPADDFIDAGTITITPPPLNDDGVTAATFPSTAAAGSDIDVEPTVVQTGTLAGTDYNISTELSTDGVWNDPNNISLSPAPSPFATINQSFHGGSVEIPDSVAAGDYQLLVSIAPWNPTPIGLIGLPGLSNSLPADQNPGDDVLNAGTISISEYIPPDDGVTAATFPSTAGAGTNIDVEPTVVQTGALANDDYNITVALSTSGTWGDSNNIILSVPPSPFGSITIGNSSFHSGDLVIPTTIPAGDYQLLVQIEPWNSSNIISWPPGSNSLPADTDPSDDVLNAGPITVTPYQPPDDAVTGATFPTTAAAGSNIDVEPTIIQQGTLAGTGYQISLALSTSGVWGDSGNYELSGINPPLQQLSTLGWVYQSGLIGIPTNVPAGQYQLLAQIQPYTSPYTLVFLGSNSLPADTNPADDVADAGTITITSYVPVSNPFPPITTPILPPVINPIIPTGPFPIEPIVTSPEQVVPSVTAVAGGAFQYSTSGVRYSSLFLSSDDQLNVSKGASRKLLSAGATLTLGAGDTKLKSGAHQTAVVPAGMAPGTYDLLGVSEGDITIVEIATVTVYPTISGPSKVVVQPSPAGAVDLEFHHSRSEIGSTMPINYYLSKDIAYSDDDAQLIMQTSTDGPAGSYSMATTGPIVAGKYYLLACTDNDGTISLGWVSAKTIAVK